jgi:arylsulfatase A-like enzyme
VKCVDATVALFITNPAPPDLSPLVENMKTRALILILGLGLSAVLSLGAGPSIAADAARPNIVFFLADDLGWRDTTPYGSTFHETPNLERLARRGMRFTQAYAANPLCSPTRSSIMTGLFPARTGIMTPSCHLEEVKLEASLEATAPPNRKVIVVESATRLKREYFTLAEALQAAGYATGHFGKWHLGREPYDPLHQGFDVDVPHTFGPSPAGTYIAPWKFPAELRFQGQPGENVEDRMAQEAVRFIRANKGRPFFLNYWAFSVHSPWQGMPRLVEKYAAKARADPENPQRNPIMGAMIETMDQSVGRLLDTLDELNLADNTVFIFSSDNGGFSYLGRGLDTDRYPVPMTSNAPLRGGKSQIYEGGVREPLIVAWPGQVAAGTTSDAVVQSTDFYPTILDLLGLKPRPGQQFDGISIVPALRQSGPLPERALFCLFTRYAQEQTPPGGSVRQGDYKLIRFFHDGPDSAHRYELYNLKDDIGETTNLAGTMPERVRALDALIEGFLSDTHAVLPRPNPAFKPPAAPRPVQASAGSGSGGVPAGWRVVRFATMSVSAGALVVTADGGVPVVMTRTPAITGDITVQFRLRTTSPGPARVLWHVGKEGNFPAERAVSVDFIADGQWHECAARVTIPDAVGRLSGIRIDPSPDTHARVEFDWIRIKKADGQVLVQWDFNAF